MFEEQESKTTPSTEGTPRWIGLAVATLAAVSLVSLGVGWNATSHARNAEQNLAIQAKSFQQNEDALGQRLSQAEEANAQEQGEMNLVSSKLQITQGELEAARKQVRQTRDDYNKQLNQVNTELKTKANQGDVDTLNTNVNGVKTDLEATKTSLASTRDQFGTLIARNHEEVEQLRRQGERDYYEFTLTSKGAKQTLGGLQIELRSTNVKHNAYSVTLVVDDKRLDKNNRSLGEPIYFITQGARTPLELVVNQIGKDRISGYLSVPKPEQPSTTASASPGN
ncbi:MAG TPA: hypothetical protein VEH50_12920 [Methylomirabilota bacterium]|jgi:chromosome segregation ATPase|nr:hypothetical protein [Methylomirabilota bacterium]